MYVSDVDNVGDLIDKHFFCVWKDHLKNNI
jgi:hypothetical protein